MFRRSISTSPVPAGDGAAPATEAAAASEAAEQAPERGRGRHTRRARRRKTVDEAALQARLDRVHRRLAQVGSVQVGRAHAIDNDAARRDPMTRPFTVPGDARFAARRSDTAALPRPA